MKRSEISATRTQCGNDTHVRIYGDMGEFVNTAARGRDWWVDRKFGDRSSIDRGIKPGARESAEDFTGTKRKGDAVRLAREGWPEGLAEIRKQSDKLVIPPKLGTDAPDLVYDVFGDTVDVGRAAVGDPYDMISFPSDEDLYGGKVVEFIVNTSVDFRVPKNEITRRGGALLAATFALQREGYSVGITAGSSVRSSRASTEIEHYVPLVEPGGYMNEDAVAFALTHAAFLRRLMFSAVEQEAPELRAEMGFVAGQGYGIPIEFGHVPEEEHAQVVIGAYDGMGEEDPAQAILDRALNALRGQQDVRNQELTREHNNGLVPMPPENVLFPGFRLPELPDYPEYPY